MQPPIQSPTLNAILQVVYALGMLAALVAPLAKNSATLYAILQRIAGLGLDLSKTFGATRVATPTGPAPKSVDPNKPSLPMKLPPLSTIIFAFTLCTFVLMVACNAAQQSFAKDASGALCEIVVQASDPKLAPLCSTLPEIEQIIFDLKKAHAGGGNYEPSGDEVYKALAAKKKKKGAGK